MTVVRKAILIVAVFSSFPCSAAQNGPQNDTEKSPFVPDRYVATAGIRFRNVAILSQENYFQDSWTLAAGAHWDFELWETEGLISAGIEKFTQLPSDKNQLGINIAEYHYGFGAGLENRTLLPVGIGMGVWKIKTDSQVSAGPFITDLSASSRWSKSFWTPAFEVWLGVPLLPDRVQLNAVYKYLSSAGTDVQKSGAGLDFRFEF
jgi:hypothetical protein